MRRDVLASIWRAPSAPSRRRERHPLEIIGERVSLFLASWPCAFLSPAVSLGFFAEAPSAVFLPAFSVSRPCAAVHARARRGAHLRAAHWALHSAALLEGGLAGWCTRNAAEGGRRTPGTTEVGYQRRACSCNGHLGFDALRTPRLCACTILHEWLSRPGARGIRPWPGCT